MKAAGAALPAVDFAVLHFRDPDNIALELMWLR